MGEGVGFLNFWVRYHRKGFYLNDVKIYTDVLDWPGSNKRRKSLRGGGLKFLTNWCIKGLELKVSKQVYITVSSFWVTAKFKKNITFPLPFILRGCSWKILKFLQHPICVRVQIATWQLFVCFSIINVTGTSPEGIQFQMSKKVSNDDLAVISQYDTAKLLKFALGQPNAYFAANLPSYADRRKGIK